MSNVAQTSIYLNEEDRRLLSALQERTGLHRSAVFRLAIRRMFEADDKKQVRLLQIAEEIKRLA